MTASSLGSYAWKQLRLQVIREEPVCRLRLPGCTRVSTTADHIIPRSQRPDLVFLRANLVGACAHCNYKKGNGTSRYRVNRVNTKPARALQFFA